MPRTVCTKLKVTPKKSVVHIVQLDRTKVEVIGEIFSVSIGLSSNPKVLQVIYIFVADIPEFYGLILSWDWSEKLHGYFATDWSHMWLPYNGKPNQIRVDREKIMKHTVTELEEANEPVAFTNNIIGNYSAESFLGSFNAQVSPFSINTSISQIENFYQIDSYRCVNLSNQIPKQSLFWTMYLMVQNQNMVQEQVAF